MSYENSITMAAQVEIVPPQPFLNSFIIEPLNATQVIPVPAESNSAVELGQFYGGSIEIQSESADREYLDLDNLSSESVNDKVPKGRVKRAEYSNDIFPCVGCDRKRKLAPLFDTSIGATEQDEIEIINYVRGNNKRGRSKLKLANACRLPHVNNLEELGPRRQVCCVCLNHAQKYINLRQTGQILPGVWLIPPPPEPPKIPKPLSQKPDLSFYRHGIASPNQCVFECHKFPKISKGKPSYIANNTQKLCEISEAHRHLLLMHFKFFVSGDARMCTSHIKMVNWWPLVKQVDRKLPSRKYFQIIEQQHLYYKEQFYAANPDAKNRKKMQRQVQVINNVTLKFKLPEVDKKSKKKTKKKTEKKTEKKNK